MRNPFRLSLMGLMLVMVLVALLFSFNLQTTPAFAQDGPTATPSDPLWLGFVAAREALEEVTGRDLSLVAEWRFAQETWDQPHPQREDGMRGIDSCNSAVHVADGRRIFHGITYRITELNGTYHEVRVSFDLETVVICDLLSTAPAPTPVPEATDEAGNPVLPAPVAGAGAVGGFELGGHVDGLDSTAISVMQSAGMTWVKKQLPMSAGVDKGIEFINAAHAAGFKILLGVIGDKNALAADFDGYVAAFSEFVAALAANGADAIEVWNEPNIDREWPVGQINGASYTQLLASAFNAIKSANPNTLVISGAPAPTGFFGAAGCTENGCNDDVFMQQMAAAGAANFLDCVGLHYNEGIMPPSAFSGDPRGEYPTYYFSSMLNRGLAPFPAGTKACFTELGYLSPEGMPGPLPTAFAWAADTSVAEHASWLADAVARAAQSGNVRLLIIWNVNFTRWDSDPMGGYAIIRPDGSCPACSLLAGVMSGG